MLLPLANPDPLAGLPFFARWQTHTGNNTLLGNLFQDATKLIPAVNSGDLVSDVASVLGTTGDLNQPTLLNAGTLAFDGSTPHISSAGSSFFVAPDMSGLTQGEIFVLVKHATPSVGDFLFQMSGTDNSFIPNSGDGEVYDSFGSSVRHNAIAASFGSGWNVYNASSQAGLWRNALNGTELFSTATNTFGFTAPFYVWQTSMGHYYPGGGMIAMFIFRQVLTAPQRALVNAYLAGLHT